tara:strand:- start:184 stop:711 length:528 start_codon:yes stop_codon:yes gene_type:complete
MKNFYELMIISSIIILTSCSTDCCDSPILENDIEVREVSPRADILLDAADSMINEICVEQKAYDERIKNQKLLLEGSGKELRLIKNEVSEKNLMISKEHSLYLETLESRDRHKKLLKYSKTKIESLEENIKVLQEKIDSMDSPIIVKDTVFKVVEIFDTVYFTKELKKKRKKVRK